MYTTKKNFAFNPDKVMDKISALLLPGEEVKALFTLSGNGSGYAVASPLRIAFFKIGESKAHVSVPMEQLEGYESSTKLGTTSYSLKLKDGSTIKLGVFLRDDEKPVLEIIGECIANPVKGADIALDTPESRDAEFTSIEANFPWTKVPKHLQKNVLANIASDEKPLFIISANAGSAAGALVAMGDRCILIKSGAMGGLLTGTLGGARVTTFYYRDITGIEYNSGMLTGVVEILTPSYNGSANKDFWKGSNKSRNADSNDPWTLSNTLPFSKLDYAAAKNLFDKLRKLISESKISTTQVITTSQSSVSDEITKLAKLLEDGLIDQDEFKEAKKKLLG